MPRDGKKVGDKNWEAALAHFISDFAENWGSDHGGETKHGDQCAQMCLKLNSTRSNSINKPG